MVDALEIPDGWPSGPTRCDALIPLVGTPIDLPCDDPWLLDAGTAGHAYLQASARAWEEHPDYMDFLDLGSPINDLKRAERDIYLHWYKPWLSARRVLDIGCGIGRLTHPFLDRGATVHGVDGDPRSLERCAWHAAGRPGRLALHWTSVHRLPDIAPVDVAIACEVLCYVPDFEGALQQIVARLRPGGALLIAMEAPWGWATAEDAPASSIAEALRGAGVIDKPGDRWVRTVTEAELRASLESAGLRVELLIPTHYLPDGPLERCLDLEISLEEVLAAEQACREHPVWAPLNRIWTCAAIRR